MSWQTHLKTLWNWVPQSLMLEWRASKRVKRHCMNFTSTFASLIFSFYNRVLSYAWNLYSSNSRKWHFLSKATSLASIFSSFNPHNISYSQASHINEKSFLQLLQNETCRWECLTQFDRPKQTHRPWFTSPSEIDRLVFKKSTWAQDSSLPPGRMHAGGKWWSID